MLFGLFHGLWYCTEVQITSSKRCKATVIRLHPSVREALGRGLFLFLMMFCFALFRSDSLEHFWSLVSALFSFQMTGASGFALREAGAWVSAAFLIILALPNSVQCMRRYRPGYITWRVPGRTPVVLDRVWRPDMGWAAMVTVMAVTCLVFLNRQTPFLYLGF